MNNKNIILTSKIIAYTNKITGYLEGAEKSAFLADTKLAEACVFNLLQIGELANQFDNNFQKTHESIPWQKVRGLRNRLVHDYEGVNLELVWDIIKNDLDILRQQFENIKNESDYL